MTEKEYEELIIGPSKEIFRLKTNLKIKEDDLFWADKIIEDLKGGLEKLKGIKK